jgi:hypothetical protein
VIVGGEEAAPTLAIICFGPETANMSETESIVCKPAMMQE